MGSLGYMGFDRAVTVSFLKDTSGARAKLTASAVSLSTHQRLGDVDHLVPSITFNITQLRLTNLTKHSVLRRESDSESNSLYNISVQSHCPGRSRSRNSSLLTAPNPLFPQNTTMYISISVPAYANSPPRADHPRGNPTGKTETQVFGPTPQLYNSAFVIPNLATITSMCKQPRNPPSR